MDIGSGIAIFGFFATVAVAIMKLAPSKDGTLDRQQRNEGVCQAHSGFVESINTVKERLESFDKRLGIVQSDIQEIKISVATISRNGNGRAQ